MNARKNQDARPSLCVINHNGEHYPHGTSVDKPETTDGRGGNAKQTKKGIISAVRELIPPSARKSVTSCLPWSVHYRVLPT